MGQYSVNNLYSCEYERLSRKVAGIVYQEEDHYTNVFANKSGVYETIHEDKIVYINSFKEELKNKKLTELIGKSRVISTNDIIHILTIMRTKKQLTAGEVEAIKNASDTIAGIISDLLGINLAINPQEILPVANDDNVAILGYKVESFLKLLSELVEISFYEMYRDESKDSMFIVQDEDGMDERVLVALRRNKINITDKLTRKHFEIEVNEKNIIVRQEGMKDVVIKYRGKELVKLFISENIQEVAWQSYNNNVKFYM